ncbi:MAG: SMC family ATPase [SAR324 cluster bacterium]|uniref:SMC family ATPase n=1 Tax=SAR324 cluster bacterium TaxID=2024889 RepID=A0A7X9FPU1_9DELT|nr:SMC family ATPase [SAR324 cluster bacterium]
MRPISITMRAFGCYAKEQTIDFSHLPESSLFLIHGPTGSGKSTILDAICFALYGRPASEGRKANELRSQLATSSLRTEVKFEFSLGSHAFRAQRSTEHPVKKKRGEGFTLEAADAALFELKDPAVPDLVASGIKKVNDKIEELLGLSFEHFRQLIVIPQNQFLRLLVADTNDRIQIFEKLFQTERFRRIEDALRIQFSEVNQKIAEIKEKRNVLAESEGVKNIEDLRLKIKLLESDLIAVKEKELQNENALKSAQSEESNAKEIVQRLREYEEAHESYNHLKLNVPLIEKERFRLNKARQSQEIEASFLAWSNAKTRLSKAQILLDEASGQLEKAKAVFEAQSQREQELGKLERVLENLIERIGATEFKASAWTEKEKQYKAESSQLRALKEKLESLESSYQNLTVQAKDIEETLNAKKVLWEGSHAARLALLLKEGKPCPVCGSQEHPAPAQTIKECPTDNEIQALESDSRRFQIKLQELRQEKALLKESITRLSESTSNLSKELELERDLAEKYEHMIEEREATSQQISAHRKAIEESKKEFSLAYSTHSSRLEALETEKRDFEQFNSQFSIALSKQQFSGLDDFLKFRLPEEERLKLDRTIKDFEAKLAVAKDRYIKAKSVLTEAPIPDMAAIKKKKKQAEEEYKFSIKERGVLQERIKRSKNNLRSLEKILDELSLMEKRWEATKQLADIAMGNNSLRISFHSFCLSAFLDDVLLSASERLRIMSDGRYELERQGDPTDRRMKSGLDIRVFDNYTGQTRSGNSLSGGEGFLAALSLALGLADVVQSYMGGIRMDTIFIDEGFGNLDPESLDRAIQALVSLQKSGRLVGIISHVPELLSRINLKIETISGRSGSSVRTNF